MDIFFSDPDDVPVPPEEVRIRELEAKPWPDGQRVAIQFHITPFQQRPNIEVKIYNSKGDEVAELSVVEALETKMEFTMHLREPNPEGVYKAHMRVFYSDLDRFEDEVSDENSAGEILKEAAIAVDEAETSFSITANHE
jgi:hypothetical protein